MKSRKSILFLSAILSLAIGSSLFFISLTDQFQKEVEESSRLELLHKPKPDVPITLMFVGDIMLDRGVEWQVVRSGGSDWRFPFQKASDFLKNADILFGNLESVISDKGQKVGSIYSFRADPQAIKGLQYAGFDIFSVANNHVFDYTREAMEDSFSRLKAAGFDYVGGGMTEKEAFEPLIKEVSGTKIAFLGFTNFGSASWRAVGDSSGVAWLTEESLKEGIAKADEEADLVIASFHYGDEYQSRANKEQEYFSRLAIDSGADLVIGHHPHVVQQTEQYKTGFIAYSLGNFIFDQKFSAETMKGLLLKVVVENKAIQEVTPFDVQMNEFFQPAILP